MLLEQISLQLAAISNGTAVSTIVTPTLLQGNQPHSSAVLVNTLWFASLVCSLIAASFGMLVRQWLRHYADGHYSSVREHIRVRQYRFHGLTSWGVFQIMEVVPVILQIALVLFLLGLVFFLRPLQVVVFSTVAILIGLWLMVYTFTTTAPTFYSECPYKSPQARLFYVFASYVNESLGHFLSRGTQHFRQTHSDHDPSRLDQAPVQIIPSSQQSYDEVHPSSGSKTSSLRSWEEREAAIRLSQNSDIDALVGIDAQFNDDVLLEVIHTPCLSHLSGPDVARCVELIVQRRLSIPGSHATKGTVSLSQTRLASLKCMSDLALTATSHILTSSIEREASLPGSAATYLLSSHDKPRSLEWMGSAVLYLSLALQELGLRTLDNSCRAKALALELRMAKVLLWLVSSPVAQDADAAFGCCLRNPHIFHHSWSPSEAFGESPMLRMRILASHNEIVYANRKTHPRLPASLAVR